MCSAVRGGPGQSRQGVYTYRPPGHGAIPRGAGPQRGAGLTEAQINELTEEMGTVPESLRRASTTVSWWQVPPPPPPPPPLPPHPPSCSHLSCQRRCQAWRVRGRRSILSIPRYLQSIISKRAV